MIAIPITLFFVGVNALISVALAFQVTRHRRRTQTSLGVGDDPSLEQAVRAHGNFVEYAPLALAMVLALEVHGAPRDFVLGLGLTLTLGRAFHAEGLIRSAGRSFGRVAGTLLTWSVYLVGGVGCVYYALT